MLANESEFKIDQHKCIGNTIFDKINKNLGVIIKCQK